MKALWILLTFVDGGHELPFSYYKDEGPVKKVMGRASVADRDYTVVFRSCVSVACRKRFFDKRGISLKDICPHDGKMHIVMRRSQMHGASARIG